MWCQAFCQLSRVPSPRYNYRKVNEWILESSLGFLGWAASVRKQSSQTDTWRTTVSHVNLEAQGWPYSACPSERQYACLPHRGINPLFSQGSQDTVQKVPVGSVSQRHSFLTHGVRRWSSTTCRLWAKAWGGSFPRIEESTRLGVNPAKDSLQATPPGPRPGTQACRKSGAIGKPRAPPLGQPPDN